MKKPQDFNTVASPILFSFSLIISRADTQCSELHSGSRHFIEDPSAASIISKQNKPLLRERK